MDLPKIDVPTYQITIPSSGKKVRIRPFLVKEEKMLLIAAQSKDTQEIIDTTYQVLSNCVVDNDVKVSDLPFFDIDYMFIALRAKSVGDTIDMNYVCNNVDTMNVGIGMGTKCGTVFPVALDIGKVSLDKKDIPSKIEFTKKTGVVMKYPKYSAVKVANDSEGVMDRKLRLIYASIDYIYDGESVYTSKEFSREDFDKWVDNLTKSQLEKLEYWVDNFPTFHISTEKVCPKCGFNHKIKYKDFNSFFL